MQPADLEHPDRQARERLGLQLFERGPRTPTPTVNGRAIIPRRKSYWTMGTVGARSKRQGSSIDGGPDRSMRRCCLCRSMADDLHWDTLLGEPILEAVPRCAARLLCGPPQVEFRPDDRERPDQIVDVGLAVQWRGRQAQPLGAARHGRVVDRLHVDPVAVQQLVADGFAQDRDRRSAPARCGSALGITGSPASARRRFRVAARSWWRSRSAWLCLQMADRGERAGGERRRQ